MNIKIKFEHIKTYLLMIENNQYKYAIVIRFKQKQGHYFDLIYYANFALINNKLFYDINSPGLLTDTDNGFRGFGYVVLDYEISSNLKYEELAKFARIDSRKRNHFKKIADRLFISTINNIKHRFDIEDKTIQRVEFENYRQDVFNRLGILRRDLNGQLTKTLGL